ncbi:MAG: hypothetical protein LC776_11665, partial [Acidobacteria bacterium]|nr:hypothetical protein [Acidobacteriota bacterium]
VTRTERLKEDHQVQNAYDLAHRGEVRIEAQELGAFLLSMEREFVPVRWALQRTSDHYYLRVLDDTGGESATTLEFYTFDAPDSARLLEREEFRLGRGATANRGLYVARAGDEWRAIVVVPHRVRSFEELRVDPQLQPRSRRPDEILELVKLVDLWAGARLPGSLLSAVMRRKVLGSMLPELFQLICGARWGKAEQGVAKYGVKGLDANREEARLAEALEHDLKSLVASAPGGRVVRLATLSDKHLDLHSAGHVRQHGGKDFRWLVEFALRLASGRPGIIDWAEGLARSGVSDLLEVPALARAARFMVLVMDREKPPLEEGMGFLHDGWMWS